MKTVSAKLCRAYKIKLCLRLNDASCMKIFDIFFNFLSGKQVLPLRLLHSDQNLLTAYVKNCVSAWHKADRKRQEPEFFCKFPLKTFEHKANLCY